MQWFFSKNKVHSMFHFKDSLMNQFHLTDDANEISTTEVNGM